MQTNRYLVKLDYQGTSFNGWQIQPNQITIQGELTRTLSLILREDLVITGAGRTDTGVHARNYVAHFDSTQHLEPVALEKLRTNWNNFLPRDIAIQKIVLSPNKVHARFDATWREYKYYIHTSKNAFNHPFSYKLTKPLNVAQMNQAAEMLTHYQDFESFSKVNTDVSNFLCTVSFAQWKTQKNGLIFTIRANRFLRNMVRAIVGTLLEVGLRKLDLEGFRRIIETKSRSAAGVSVPAQGLFLEQILYDKITNDLLEIEQ